MVLWNIYISRIPPDSLASLATRVNWRVYINDVIGDLTPIVGNIKCEVLSISNVYLSSEVIQCLVTAMRNKVVGVVLGDWGDVLMNIELLTQGYNGRGRCRYVMCHGETGRRYGPHLETWAARTGWKVDKSLGGWTIVITRTPYRLFRFVNTSEV